MSQGTKTHILRYNHHTKYICFQLAAGGRINLTLTPPYTALPSL